MLSIEKIIQKINRFFDHSDRRTCLDIFAADPEIISILYFWRAVPLGTESIKFHCICKKNLCSASLEIWITDRNNDLEKYLQKFTIDPEHYERLLDRLKQDDLLDLKSYHSPVTDPVSYDIIFISNSESKFIGIVEPELNTPHWRLTNILEEFVGELRQQNLESGLVKLPPDTWWQWFTGRRKFPN